jgi:hypothetical protein
LYYDLYGILGIDDGWIDGDDFGNIDERDLVRVGDLLIQEFLEAKIIQSDHRHRLDACCRISWMPQLSRIDVKINQQAEAFLAMCRIMFARILE